MIGIDKIENDSQQLFIITEKGMGKRVAYDEFNAKGRGGKGMMVYSP